VFGAVAAKLDELVASWSAGSDQAQPDASALVLDLDSYRRDKKD
jgi:hypothetical protein